jgi:hypothetical protein
MKMFKRYLVFKTNVGRRLKRERQVVAIGRINKLRRFFLDVEYLEVEDEIKLMWHVAELDALHVKRIHLVGCFHIVIIDVIIDSLSGLLPYSYYRYPVRCLYKNAYQPFMYQSKSA